MVNQNNQIGINLKKIVAALILINVFLVPYAFCMSGQAVQANPDQAALTLQIGRQRAVIAQLIYALRQARISRNLPLQNSIRQALNTARIRLGELRTTLQPQASSFLNLPEVEMIEASPSRMEID